MKRVLAFLFILLMPVSVWAMTPVTDSDLSNITGQAGVSINADLSMDISIGTMAWGDRDGDRFYWTGGSSIGGFIGIDNFNLSGLRVRARTETGDHYNNYSTMFLKPITIDVARDAAGTAYSAFANGGGSSITFVRIGLGALQISLNTMSLNVGTGAYQPVGTDVSINEIMGSVNLGNMELYINPMSYVDIFAKTGSSGTGQGVIFAMGVVIDRLEFGYLSWGDADGFDTAYETGPMTWNSADTSAGYVGFNGLYMGDADDWAIKVAGTVAIDVYTLAAGKDVYSYAPAAAVAMYLYYFYNPASPGYGLDPTVVAADPVATATRNAWIVANGSEYFANIQGDPNYYVAMYGSSAGAYNISVVHITFPGTLTVNVGAIRSQVCLSNVPQLTTGAGTGVMGDIYLQGISINIKNNSWVDIWAHRW